MNCPECQNLIQERLDGGDFLADAEVDRHLAECRECRQLQEAARRLEEGLRLLPVPFPPPGFADRMVQQVLVQRRRHRTRRLALTVGSLAAAVLIAVLAVQNWPPAAVLPATTGPVVAEKPPAPPPAPPPPSLSDSFAEVSSAVAALARRTTEQTVDQTRVLWLDPMPTVARVEPAEPAPELAAQSLWEAGQGVSAGLEPVTTSARRAVDLFLRELPPMPAAGPDLN
jgi:hypothetical protein